MRRQAAARWCFFPQVNTEAAVEAKQTHFTSWRATSCTLLSTLPKKTQLAAGGWIGGFSGEIVKGGLAVRGCWEGEGESPRPPRPHLYEVAADAVAPPGVTFPPSGVKNHSGAATFSLSSGGAINNHSLALQVPQ